MIQQQLHDYLGAVLWVAGLVFASLTLARLVRLIRRRNAFHRAFIQVSPDRVTVHGLQDSQPPEASPVAYPQDRALDQ
jgi:hypothetical protein